MKKRLLSMLLCLCMVFTLVGTMVPMTSAASLTPLTDDQIIAKIDEYISAVEAWKQTNGTDKVYWNGGYRNRATSTEELKGFVDRKDYTSGLSKIPCDGGTQHNYSGQGCNSNRFDGVDLGGTQCSGFAAYMEYVIFQTTADWKQEFTVSSDYNFRPGDLIRSGGHSYVVYKTINSNVHFIECNWRTWNNYGNSSDYCIIRWNRSQTQSALRATINGEAGAYVARPPASLRRDSTTTVPLPSTPSEITGEWTSTGPQWQARISWPAVSGATRYEVEYRTPTANGWSEWKKDGDYTSGTSYISKGLGNYDFYQYRVRACNAGGASGWKPYTLEKKQSEVVTPPPAKPEWVSATWILLGMLSPRVSWSPVSGAEHYEVQYKQANMSSWSSSVTVHSETSYTFSVAGLTISYNFRVRAINSGGSSAWAECSLLSPINISVDLKEKEPTTVSAPTGVTAKWKSTGSNASAELTWNAVSDVDFYEIEYKKAGGSWRAIPQCPNNLSTSYAFSNLDSSLSYSFRIKAIKGNVSSVWAEYTLVKSDALTKLTAPSGVSGTWTSTGPNWQAKISWNAVNGATSYEVQYRTPTTGNAWRTDSDYSSGTSYISTGLGNYNSYDYRVRAVNAGGASDWTEYTLVKAPAATAPAAPTNVSGSWTSRGPNWQARISWEAVSGATRYEVQYRTPTTGNAWRTDSDYSSGTSYISTGLGNYNSYDYRVRAVNANGASAWTEYTLYK